MSRYSATLHIGGIVTNEDLDDLRVYMWPTEMEEALEGHHDGEPLVIDIRQISNKSLNTILSILKKRSINHKAIIATEDVEDHEETVGYANGASFRYATFNGQALLDTQEIRKMHRRGKLLETLRRMENAMGSISKFERAESAREIMSLERTRSHVN